MAQIFHRSTNVLSRASLFGGVVAVGLVLGLFAAFDRSAYATREGVVREQPIPFSHSHHVGHLGIDCRYCHTSVEDSSFAGIPPTETCMQCHRQLWKDTPMLAPLRASWRSGEPIEWTRVNDLPDFAQFDHSIHVAKGVGCTECHGRVDGMPLVAQQESLKMEWCLECHEHPEPYLRPVDEVFDPTWTPPADRQALGEEVAEELDVHPRLSCSACHR